MALEAGDRAVVRDPGAAQRIDEKCDVAAVLRNVKSTPAAYELFTRDDSRLRVNQITVSKEGIQVQNGMLAGLKIPASDIIELKAGYRPGAQARAE